MTGYAHTFDVNKFNMERNDFDPEKDTARPIFYMEDRIDPVTQGIIKIEMIRIQSPGEALNVFGGPVRPVDKDRFRAAYEAFKRGESIVDGTPLSSWPEASVNPDFVSQLRGFGFQTVEDVAKMADSAQRLFHGSLVWKRKAQIYVDQQKKLKAADAEAAKESAKDAELSALRERIAALETAPPKNKGGRPRKVKAVEQPAA